MKQNSSLAYSLFVLTTAAFIWLEPSARAYQAGDKAKRPKPELPAHARALGHRTPSSDQLTAAQLGAAAGFNVKWHPRLGTPRSIRGRALGQRGAYSGGKGLALGHADEYAQNAVVVLDNLSRFYRIQDAEIEFAVKRQDTDALGYHHVRLKQVHRGIPVMGGELVVHFDGTGEAYEVNGEYVAELHLDPLAKIDADGAVAAAQEDLVALGYPEGALVEGPALVVFSRATSPQLAYALILASDDAQEGPGRWRYWVDAQDGTVLLRYNDIKHISPPTSNGAHVVITGSILAGEGGQSLSLTGWRENTGIYYLRHTNQCWYVYNVAASGYTDNNTYAYRSSSNWGTSDRVEMSAARNFDTVQLYFARVQGRDSFDDSGLYARANVHEGINYVNAYWDGTAFYFGDGDGVQANSLATLDICAHEYTHAVIDYTSDLIYFDESGALNESFSDILAACVEFYAQPDGRAAYPAKSPGAADWFGGEDSWLSSVALRDLRNPRNTDTVGAGNEQPSRYRSTYWYTGSGDNGGVHINSGVQNFFFYLLCEGGSGDNDGLLYNVTGIGITNAEQIAYRALTVYCTPNTDYPVARSAWISAALDLNTNWAGNVRAAWAAVGIGALSVEPLEGLVFRGPVGGPFTPNAGVFSLVNADATPMNWAVLPSENWVDVSPTNGTLAADGSTFASVGINAAASALAAGLHTNLLTFSNTLDGVPLQRPIRLLVGYPDYFTELFDAADNDLDFQTWTFTPDGTADFYSVCRETTTNFPTDPAGGTHVSLTDDSYRQITLTGTNTVAIYGRRANIFFIGSNGYLTMNSGDTAYTESLVDHFRLPRVSACFDDLNPGTGGSISWKQTTNRVAVTYLNVREYGTSVTVSLQVEMFYDGRIRVTYLDVGMTDGLAGLSAGVGLPAEFMESDLTSYGACVPPDDLFVTPRTGLVSEGYEGGPFTPTSTDYLLVNRGTNLQAWEGAATEPWVELFPPRGALPLGASTNVVIRLTAWADSLPPGFHSAIITLSNLSTGFAHTRTVGLNVLARPGEIAVLDSVPPDNDLRMPFETVIVGVPRMETITVTNSDSEYDLIISEIALGGTFAGLGSSGTPLEFLLPATLPGNPASEPNYLPLDYPSAGRPETTLRVDHCYRSSSVLDVLIVAAGENPSRLRTGLAGFPDIATANYYDARAATPSLAQLSGYDVVVVMANNGFANSTQMGNVLADYMDSGGALVEAVATFGTGGGWELAGRLVDGGYEPFLHGPGEFIPHWLGTYDASHPIMQGVSSLSDGLPAAVSLQTNAQRVASWNNGLPLVAVAASGVVGINLFAFDSGDYTGDVVMLFHNAIVFSDDEGVFSLASLPPLPCVMPPGSSLTFDVVYAPTEVGSNAAIVFIENDDADESRVEVQLSGRAVLDYLLVTPDADLVAEGHPAGPFTPDSMTYTLSNAGPVDIAWVGAAADNWVSVSPPAGSLVPGASTNITVGFSAQANSLPVGNHLSAVTFSNLTTTAWEQRHASLTIFTSPQIVVDPGSIAVTNPFGTHTLTTLTVSNALTADADLTFHISARETGRSTLALTAAGVGLPPVGRDFTRTAPDSEFSLNRLLVRFADSIGDSQRTQLLSALGGAEIMREYALVPGLCLVKLPAGQSIEQALQSFNQTAGILYAEPDYLVQADVALPDDPRFSELWGMDNTGQTGGAPDADIDAPEAWDLNTGSGAVVVAVIDTGVDYTHPDLVNNIWINPGEIPGNGLDDDGNGFVDDVHGYDFCNNDGDPRDDHYHGTHVAGTVGAEGDNRLGVAGVCWDVGIMVVKFLDASGSGYTADAIASVEYATLMGARVMNNSWGGGAYSQALKDAIDAAGAVGVVFVAAAGNTGTDNDITPHYPSSYESDNVIAVINTDWNDTRAPGSAYGLLSVDLGAPGSSILSCQPGGGYQMLSGTSMASPHVAGACALLLAANPVLGVEELKEALLSTVDPTLPGQCVSGGRLNLARALASMVPPWLTILPEGATNLAPGTAARMTVAFQADGLDPGTYDGELVITCNDIAHPTVRVPVALTVLPEDLQVIPGDSFVMTGAAGGPFTLCHRAYTLTNTGASAFKWEIHHASSWLSASPSSGVLMAGGTATATIAVTGAADALAVGEYTDTILFSNSFSGGIRTRSATLNVVTPALDIADAEALEGDAGESSMVFGVQLDPVSSLPITVSYVTSNGTALAGSDYLATNGVLTFAPGQTHAEVTVTILGDTNAEPSETFRVHLSSPVNAMLMRTQAVGTILSEELPPFFDDFEPGIDLAQWSAFGGAVGSTVLATNYGGHVSSPNSLWFGAAGSRFAASRSLDARLGGVVEFWLRIARGSSSTWETADLPAEGIVLEYSTDSGSIWVEFGRYDTSTYNAWTHVTEEVPLPAQTVNTQFRWRQLSNSGTGFDHWALDDVQALLGPQPPVIVTHPADRSVRLGHTATFDVEASGSEPLAYQWRKEGVAIAQATNMSLTLVNVQTNQAGRYSVLVSNDFGSALSSSALLTVRVPQPPEVPVAPVPTDFATGVSVHTLLSWNAAGLASIAGPRVLLIWDINNEDTRTLKSVMEGAGLTVTLSETPETGYDGSNPSLAGFDVVVHLNGTTFGAAMPVAGQQALVEFVQSGGGYVGSEWNAFEISEGRMLPMRNLVLFDRAGGNTGSLIVTDIAGMSDHPVLANVPANFSFFAGYNEGAIHAFSADPAEPLMRDGSGNDAVAVREFGLGRIVGFHHAGNYAHRPLTNSNIQQLYVDGIVWSAGVSGATSVYNVSLGTNPTSMSLVASNLAQASYDPGPLAFNTSYYWQIVASNLVGSVTGAVWRFTTTLDEVHFTSVTNSVAEDAGSAWITVERENPAGGTVRVEYATTDGTATAGSDYTAAAGTLEFAAGVMSASFQVSIVDDAGAEGDETVLLELSQPSTGVLLAAPSNAVLTIEDNDAVRVSLFFDPAYVDTSTSTSGEAANVIAALGVRNCQVHTFTGITPAAFSSALMGADMLYLPELENGDLASALSSSARTVIAEFVNGGGGLIINGQMGSRDETFVNQVFGHTIVTDSSGGVIGLTANAVGTAFEGGPGSVLRNNGTYEWLTSSLPANSRSIYEDGSGFTTAVALIPHGSGKIAFLAYDWFDAVPRGTQDGGWDDLLRRAVLEVAKPPDDLLLDPSEALVSSGYRGGPFDPSDKVYVVSNTGASNLSWSASCTQGWVSVVPSRATLPPDGSTNAILQINANAQCLGFGIHTASVAFSNEATGVTQTRAVQLTVHNPFVITQSNIFHPNVLTYAFHDAGRPAGPGALTVTALADLDDSTEYLRLLGEGILTEDLFVSGGLQMMEVTTVVNLTESQLAAMAADGVITFTLSPSAAVNDFGWSYARLELEYPSEGVLHHYTWGGVGATQSVNVPFPVSLTAVDVLGDVVTNFTGSVALSGWEAGGQGSMIEDFESGTWPHAPWIAGPGGTVSPAHAHDGTYGLVDPEWSYRTDVQMGSAGDVLSWWIRPSLSNEGRAYLGFAASAAGCWSLVAAPNSSALILQQNVGYGYADVEFRTQAWQANRWYKVAVEFLSSSSVVCNLYDSDGTTLLNSLSYGNVTGLPGGVAIRSFRGFSLDTIASGSGVSGQITVLPASSGQFAAGVWTGDLTVLQAATNVVLYAEDVGGHSGLSISFDVMTNLPPVADAGPDQTNECAGSGTLVQLEGSGSADPNGDPLAYAWSLGSMLLGTNAVETVSLPLGGHDITLTVTDPSGASGTDATRVTVVDTTPPALTCPGGVSVEFAHVEGTPVTYVVTAIDGCSAVNLQVVPPSGSLFPIGTNSVQSLAVDLSGNLSSCSFDVVVLGAKGVEEVVLSELQVLHGGCNDHAAAVLLGEAITELLRALDPALWIDQTHIVRNAGDIVFHGSKNAAHALERLIQEGGGCAPEAMLAGVLNRLVKVNRMLAMVSINDAGSAGVHPNKIAEDLKQLAKGDRFHEGGLPQQAIESYRHAWKHSAHMSIHTFTSLTGGGIQVEFLGIDGLSYGLEASTNLLDWEPIGTAATDQDGNVRLIDRAASQYNARYYRVVHP